MYSADVRKSPIALVTLLCFGCATIRVPIGAPAGEELAAAGGARETQLELWLESGESVSPAEQAEAWRAAHSALALALARRNVAADALGAADPVLFVRERAVARTPSRRRDQTAAVVGLVVGFVVVVAVVAVVLVSSKGGSAKPASAAGHSSAPPSAARPSGAKVAAAAPSAQPAGAARPSPAQRPAVALPPAGPAPRAGPVGSPAPVVQQAEPLPHFYSYTPAPRFYYDPWLDLGLYIWISPEPLVYAPRDQGRADDAPDEQSPAARALEESAPPPPAADAPESAPPALPPPTRPALQLPTEPDYPVGERGFFAGDDTLLEISLLDRATGLLLWTRTVQDGSDPRNPRDLGKLFDEALTGQRWVSSTR